jgi:beta-N-acetylhexosaminidase
VSVRRLVLALAVVVVAGVVATIIAARSGGTRPTPAPARPDYAASARAPVPTNADATATTPAAARPHVPGSSSAAVAARLSPLQLLGQRIIYAYAGTDPPAALIAQIRQGEAGGVIFFGPNVADPAALSAAVRKLKAANAQSPVHASLLLMTDQEGGEVRRLPGAPVLSEKQIGESRAAAALAAQAGTGAGETLAGVGLNLNLAPVLDVFRSSGNFIDSTRRSYGADPARVATLGARFITAQQRVGVAATAKHFPGLGAATAGQDTDAAPVRLDVPAAELRSVDELPYRAAIAAGVKLVMASWAVYPALDMHRPSGLSSTVVGGELRGRLGFKGVVITDELAAPALGAFGTIGHRAGLAAAAGVDLLLCSVTNPDENTPQEGLLALQGLSAALAAGQISRASAVQAAARIIALRSSLH